MGSRKKRWNGREEFVLLLTECGVRNLAQHPERESFLMGEGDIPLGELGVDSLALMEIGINIEITYGVTISPNRIASMNTLGSLWTLVERSEKVN